MSNERLFDLPPAEPRPVTFRTWYDDEFGITVSTDPTVCEHPSSYDGSCLICGGNTRPAPSVQSGSDEGKQGWAAT